MMRLLIRADGSATTGLGHVMRTIALAEAATRRGWDVRYVSKPDPAVVDTLVSRGFERDGPDGDGWLDLLTPTDLVLFDGYGFGPAVMEQAGRRAAAVLAICDQDLGRFPVDVLLNPNPGELTQVETCPRTSRLSGPTFALVRDEFRSSTSRRTGSDDVRSLLVTMGGSDVAGLGPSIARRLAARFPDATTTLLRGPAAPDPGPMPDHVEVLHAPAKVAMVFAEADVAVAAAGTTAWELLYLGVPTALVEVADNQRAVRQGAVAAGAALDLDVAATALDLLGPTLARLSDAGVRRRLSERATTLVDGRGPDRVLETLLRAAS